MTLTALAGFVLFSYVSPICKVWFPGLALGRWQLPRWEWIPTRATLLAMYESRGYWADAQVQSMMADGARYNAGLWYHSMESRSIVAGVLALIGALVSLSTRILPAPKARVQHWAIGLFFLVILQPVQDAVTRALLSGRLAPALVAFSVRTGRGRPLPEQPPGPDDARRTRALSRGRDGAISPDRRPGKPTACRLRASADARCRGSARTGTADLGSRVRET